MSRTNNDSSQLTIDNTIAAQIAVHQKSSMNSPQWVVFSVIQRIDDDVEQAERQDVQRDRDDLHDRFDDRVDQPEYHADDEDDPDSLHCRFAADKFHSRNDQGDYP